MDWNFDHQTSLIKSKCLYSNNCLCFLNRALPLWHHFYDRHDDHNMFIVQATAVQLNHIEQLIICPILCFLRSQNESESHGQANIKTLFPHRRRYITFFPSSLTLRRNKLERFSTVKEFQPS